MHLVTFIFQQFLFLLFDRLAIDPFDLAKAIDIIRQVLHSGRIGLLYQRDDLVTEKIPGIFIDCIGAVFHPFKSLAGGKLLQHGTGGEQ
jgi:hypothetical protein